MTPYEKIAAGDEAKSVLTNAAFQKAMSEAREDAIRGLLEDTQDKRADHIATIRAIEILRQRLQSIVTTGQNAQKQA